MLLIRKQNVICSYKNLVKNSEPADCVEMLATDPLYILYTSGTTGKPKGILRDTGGYATALKYSMKYIYGVDEGDTFWAASQMLVGLLGIVILFMDLY